MLLADNGSTDGAPGAGGRRAGVRCCRTGGNLGYGRAANLGVAAAPGDWVVLANPDLRWLPGAIDALLEAAERWPRAGVLGPLIQTPDGDVYPSARELPSLGRGIGHALFGWWWPANPWTAAYRQERGEPTRAAGRLAVRFLPAGRRAAFDSVGGFDPRTSCTSRTSTSASDWPGRLAEHLRAGRDRDPTVDSRRHRRGPPMLAATTPAPAVTSSRRYTGLRWKPVLAGHPDRTGRSGLN